MKPELKTLLTNVVDYIEYTQPLLEKAASSSHLSDEYFEKLAEAVDTMADNGLIDYSDRSLILEKLADSPEKVVEALCKLSEKIGPDTLGGPSDEINTSTLDPIFRFCFD